MMEALFAMQRIQAMSMRYQVESQLALLKHIQRKARCSYCGCKQLGESVRCSECGAPQ